MKVAGANRSSSYENWKTGFGLKLAGSNRSSDYENWKTRFGLKVAGANRSFGYENRKIDFGLQLARTNQSSTLSNEFGATRGDNVREISYLGDNNAQKGLKDGKTNQKISEDDEVETTSGSALKTNESLVSNTWRLPRNKRGGKHPGFNSDYSPPKTHPHSHN